MTTSLISGARRSVCLCSRAARAGPSDVHYSQAGGPLLPWTQGGERSSRALPLCRTARACILHRGDAAGSPRPGAGRGVCHPGAPDTCEPGSAHAQGQWPCWARGRSEWRAERGTPVLSQPVLFSAQTTLRERDLAGPSVLGRSLRGALYGPLSPVELRFSSFSVWSSHSELTTTADF